MSGTDGLPDYPVTGGIESAGADPYPKQLFLDVLDKDLPEAFTEPLKAVPGTGYELLQGAAKVGERVSLAINRLEVGGLVSTAPGASLASATVRLTRTSGGVAGTVLAGTVVTTSRGGRDFVIQADVAFGNADNGPHDVQALAIAAGYEWNVPGPGVTAGGEALAGEIDTIRLPMLDPPYWDTTLSVAQVTDAAGGAPPMLEGLGADRGIQREVGEGEDAYRLRVKSLPDVVTPDAIRRAASRTLDHLGIKWKLIETFQHDYQECFDAPSPNVGTPTYTATPPTNPDFDQSLFVYDDPRPLTFARFANLWLDEFDYRGAFIVVLQCDTILDVGLAYDDPGMVPSDFRHVGYQRGSSAYDLTGADDPAVVYGPCYDGFDLTFNGAAAALVRTLRQIKAAGILVAVERAP